MDDKALDYIADAMIEASGALRVAITADNSVQYIVEKLDRAICKARGLKGLPAQRGIAVGVNIAPDGQILGSATPPPIPQQDHGQADQSPTLGNRVPVPTHERADVQSQFSNHFEAAKRQHINHFYALKAEAVALGVDVNAPEKACDCGDCIECDARDPDNIPTRIVRPHMTEGA
jgi:hypothetical protein